MCQGEWSTVQKQLALKQLHLLMPLNTDTVCVSMQAVHVCALAFHRMSSNRVCMARGSMGTCMTTSASTACTDSLLVRCGRLMLCVAVLLCLCVRSVSSLHNWARSVG